MKSTATTSRRSVHTSPTTAQTKGPLRTVIKPGKEGQNRWLSSPFPAVFRYNEVTRSGWHGGSRPSENLGAEKDSHSHRAPRRVTQTRGGGSPPGAPRRRPGAHR